jgi:hypothetical protein
MPKLFIKKNGYNIVADKNKVNVEIDALLNSSEVYDLARKIRVVEQSKPNDRNVYIDFDLLESELRESVLNTIQEHIKKEYRKRLLFKQFD